jgi:hypothetical protein
MPVQEHEARARQTAPDMVRWVRSSLLIVTLGLIGVFAVAAWLNPYQANGQARTMETHLQLGLAPCTFKRLTGLPCPSCGMTTSFALLMHGDLWNSLRANAVGTLLAIVGLVYIPWSLASIACKRTLFIRSLEQTALVLTIFFVGLMLLRWVVVIGLMFCT